MTIIAMPSTLVVGAFSIGQKRFDLGELSDSTGSTRTRLLGPPRWTFSIAAPDNGIVLANASIWEAMILQLRGGVNHLAIYDLLRPLPRGTARGTMTLNGALAAGATSIPISATGQNTLTLLTGDWLQIDTPGLTAQLVKLVADATFNTTGATVVVEPPIRQAHSSGAAVTYSQALTYAKLVSDAPQWNAVPGWNTQSGYAIDLIEQWA